jgi:hypothetical protein
MNDTRYSLLPQWVFGGQAQGIDGSVIHSSVVASIDRSIFALCARHTATKDLHSLVYARSSQVHVCALEMCLSEAATES